MKIGVLQKLLLAEQGLSINDLMADPLHQAKKLIKAKTKLPPKYRLVDLDGKIHEWTGRGLPPKVFRKYFDGGHTKESCLIIKNIPL